LARAFLSIDFNGGQNRLDFMDQIPRWLGFLLVIGALLLNGCATTTLSKSKNITDAEYHSQVTPAGQIVDSAGISPSGPVGALKAITVKVDGLVKSPGYYVLSAGTSVKKALEAAGGFKNLSYSNSTSVISLNGRKSQVRVNTKSQKSGAAFKLSDGDLVFVSRRLYPL
jgi:hypothetical protein